MKEGEKVLEVEPGHANEAVEKPDANAKDDEMKVRELAVALKPATVKENEVAEDPEADIKITDGEKSVEMEPTSASVKVNDEAVEKADGKAKNNEMKAREAAVALEPASVKENEVVEDLEADIRIKLDIVDPKTNKCFNITNGKVVIVGDGIATKGVLEFSLVRVDTPAFAACTMSSESTRETRKTKKIFKRKSKFGRSLRKKRRSIPSVSQPSVPSFVEMDATVASTVSSLSNETVRKDSMERSLARREKQVQSLKLDNKKKTRKIAKLSKELTIVKQQFMKEKKNCKHTTRKQPKRVCQCFGTCKISYPRIKGFEETF